MTTSKSSKKIDSFKIIEFFEGVVRLREKATIIESRNRNGSTSYQAYNGTDTNKKPVRRSLGTNLKRAHDILSEINKRIAAGRFRDSVNAFEASIDFEIKAALKKLEGHNATIIDAAEFFIKHHNPRTGIITVEEAGQLFFNKLEREGKSRSYIGSMQENYVGPFIKRFHGKRIIDISQNDAEDYIFKSKSNLNAKQKDYQISHLSVFFNHLVELGYTSPELNQFKKLRKPQTRSDDDTYLSDQDRIPSIEIASSLLTFSETQKEHQLLAAMALVLFCGVRVEETIRLLWSNIKINNNTVTIDIPDLMAKKRRRRVIVAPANVESWLNISKETSTSDKGLILHKVPRGKKGIISALTEKNLKQRFKRFRLKWRESRKGESKYYQNSIRVSFASYGLPFFGIEKTCEMMGERNPQTFWHHYQEYTDHESSEKYFNIIPKEETKRLDYEARKQAEKDSQFHVAVKVGNTWQPVTDRDGTDKLPDPLNNSPELQK